MLGWEPAGLARQKRGRKTALKKKKKDKKDVSGFVKSFCFLAFYPDFFVCLFVLFLNILLYPMR